MANKFNIGDQLFCLNKFRKPFVKTFLVKGILECLDYEAKYLYTNRHATNVDEWIPECSLFSSRKEAYNFIINNAIEECIT
jgi:hypothetical protein